MGEFFGYLLLWAIAGAVIGGFAGNDSFLVGALQGVAIALFPVYALLFIMVNIVMWPLAKLCGLEDQYDDIISKISIW